MPLFRMTPGPRALAAAATVSVALITSAAIAAEPAIDKPAPDFVATDSNGKTHTLGDLRGKTVVLEWTNHECPFVGKHYNSGNMQALQQAAAAEGVVWLSVISSARGEQGHVEAKEANTLTETRKAAPAAVLLDPDGTIGRAYGARTTPHMYVIDAKGRLVYKGAIDDKPSWDPGDIKGAQNHVRAALDALAQGKPVSPAATRAYGCSVKYGS